MFDLLQRRVCNPTGLLYLSWESGNCAGGAEDCVLQPWPWNTHREFEDQ